MDAALNEVHNHDEKVKAKAAGKGKDKRSHGNLPTAFDWRNVNGVNFMLPAVNQVCRMIPRLMGYRAAWDTVQGDCGSCYAVAVADMITARVAVQTNNSVRQLPHPHRDWAHRCHTCTRSGLTTSIPGLGSPLPHPPRDWARPCRIRPVTGLAPTHPRQPHRDSARSGPRVGWLREA